MKIYQVDYEEVTIVSKFVDAPTVEELDDNQFVSEHEATTNLEQHLEDMANASKHQAIKDKL